MLIFITQSDNVLSVLSLFCIAEWHFGSAIMQSGVAQSGIMQNDKLLKVMASFCNAKGNFVIRMLSKIVLSVIIQMSIC